MNTCTAPTVLPARNPAFARIADFFLANARALDAWLATRRRVARDRDDLAGMSDRELLDIGCSRSSVDAAATGGWSRDTFV